MDHQIEDLSARQNFTMLPNCVMMWPGITHTALHLYLWYKMICGERPEGRCWTSLNTISEHCGMDRKTVISAREKLAEIGLIKVTKQRTSAGSEVVLISIVDVWDQNREWRFPDKQKDSVQEGGGKEPLTEQMGGGKLPLGGWKTPTRGGGKLPL